MVRLLAHLLENEKLENGKLEETWLLAGFIGTSILMGADMVGRAMQTPVLTRAIIL